MYGELAVERKIQRTHGGYEVMRFIYHVSESAIEELHKSASSGANQCHGRLMSPVRLDGFHSKD